MKFIHDSVNSKEKLITNRDSSSCNNPLRNFEMRNNLSFYRIFKQWKFKVEVAYLTTVKLYFFLLFSAGNVDIRYSSTSGITNHIFVFNLLFCNLQHTLNHFQFNASDFNISFKCTKSFLAMSINAIIIPHAIGILLALCIIPMLNLKQQNGLQSTGYYIQTLVV